MISDKLRQAARAQTRLEKLQAYTPAAVQTITVTVTYDRDVGGVAQKEELATVINRGQAGFDSLLTAATNRINAAVQASNAKALRDQVIEEIQAEP
jgi:muramidase (phage lysozyme)